MRDNHSPKTESIETLLHDLYPGSAPKNVLSLVIKGRFIKYESDETLAEIRKQEGSARGGAHIQLNIICDDIYHKLSAIPGAPNWSAGEKSRARSALLAEIKEREQIDPRVAPLVVRAEQWALLAQVAELIHSIVSGKPARLYPDEVYALLPAHLREQGAIAKAEAEAERQAKIESREAEKLATEDRNKLQAAAEAAATRYQAELLAIPTLDLNAVIEKLFSAPHEREAVRDMFQGAFNSQPGADAVRRLEGQQRDFPDERRGLLLGRLRMLEAQRRNATVLAR